MGEIKSLLDKVEWIVVDQPGRDLLKRKYEDTPLVYVGTFTRKKVYSVLNAYAKLPLSSLPEEFVEQAVQTGVDIQFGKEYPVIKITPGKSRKARIQNDQKKRLVFRIPNKVLEHYTGPLNAPRFKIGESFVAQGKFLEKENAYCLDIKPVVDALTQKLSLKKEFSKPPKITWVRFDGLPHEGESEKPLAYVYLITSGKRKLLSITLGIPKSLVPAEFIKRALNEGVTVQYAKDYPLIRILPGGSRKMREVGRRLALVSPSAVLSYYLGKPIRAKDFSKEINKENPIKIEGAYSEESGGYLLDISPLIEVLKKHMAQ